jgi:subtilisin family serine protease
VALVAALAPAAKIHAIKIYSAQGSGLTRPAEDGIRKAVQDGANVIFMDCCGNAGSEGLTTAVEAAVKAGILVAAPAGNEKQTELPLPAALDGVMAVAALGPDGKPAAFTNRDASVLFAPGVEIATIDDRMAPTRLSGTSRSATIASAIAAVVWAAKPGWSAQQIRRLLADTAVDIGPLDARRPTAGRIRRLDLAAAAAAPAGAVDAAARECARDCRRTFSDCNMNTVKDATSTSRDACQAQLKACVAACGQR